MLRDLAKQFPIFGGLVDCSWQDHWESLGQTTVVLVLSTMPIWLGTIIVYATGDTTGYGGFRSAFYGTLGHGALFTYCTALLAPIFWIALVDPPGARVFPSKVSHMVVIVIIDVIAAVFFGLVIAGKKLDEQFTFRLSTWAFFSSLVLLYLGTLYHVHRMPDVPGEFRKQQEGFSAAYGEHRQ
jgi:hypothetical protein